MKILLISNLFPPYCFGGYELYAGEIVSRMREKGHEVYILTCQGREFQKIKYIYGLFKIKPNDFPNSSRVSNFKKFKRFFFNFENLRITSEVIREVNPDLISIWNLRLLSIMPLMAATMERKPMVIHLYDPWLIPFKKVMSENIFIKIFMQPFLFLVNRFISLDNIIVCSQVYKDQHIAAGFAKENITIISHGIKIEKGLEEKKSESPKLGNNGLCNLLIVSSLSKEKGIHVALEALLILIYHRKINDIFLNIYGGGDIEYEKRLKKMVDENKISSFVKFNGRVAPQELKKIFNEHDIFICPEIWISSPLVLLEAMAGKLAVIGTDVGGMKEIIKNGVNGLLVPADDAEKLAEAIELLKRNAALREKFGEEARKIVERDFDITDDVNRIERYYLNLLSK